MAKVAVLGHGVVGSGVVEVLMKNTGNITQKVGESIEVKYILDIREFNDLSYKDKFTKDFSVILHDPEISVVAEVMGGLSPSFEYVRACLEAGKSVVTSNKELVAAKGALLLNIAREHNVNFFFEASVGGGIPIIRPLHQCLAANKINEIAGILNGTTNFILTKMIHEQMDFSEALALAQKLGYAERNPAADVEGYDTCRKICILASLAYGKHIYPDSVYTEGITKITLADVQYADNWGGVIKLIGRAKHLEDGRCLIMVSPALIARTSQLAGIEDVFNGILVRGDATGDVVFYGRGAGKLPTASAVVADIIDAVKAAGTHKSLYWVDDGKNWAINYKESETAFYLRLTGKPAAELKELAQAQFGEIEVLTQKEQPADEFACVTQSINEGRMDELVSGLTAAGACVASKIRVLEY